MIALFRSLSDWKGTHLSEQCREYDPDCVETHKGRGIPVRDRLAGKTKQRAASIVNFGWHIINAPFYTRHSLSFSDSRFILFSPKNGAKTVSKIWHISLGLFRTICYRAEWEPILRAVLTLPQEPKWTLVGAVLENASAKLFFKRAKLTFLRSVLIPIIGLFWTFFVWNRPILELICFPRKGLIWPKLKSYNELCKNCSENVEAEYIFLKAWNVMKYGVGLIFREGYFTNL